MSEEKWRAAQRVVSELETEIARLQVINYNYEKRELAFDKSERKIRAFDEVLQHKDAQIQELERCKSSAAKSSLRKARLLQEKDSIIAELQAKIAGLQAKIDALIEGEEK